MCPDPHFKYTCMVQTPLLTYYFQLDSSVLLLKLGLGDIEYL